MREIKFRAWYPGEGMKSFDKIRDDTVGMLFYATGIKYMQYTGLKDKNGKEIYEGDIVLCGDNGESFPEEYDETVDGFVNTHKAVVVGPTEDYPAFEIDPNPCDDVNGLSQLMATGEIEVIGNIHENPELLK